MEDNTKLWIAYIIVFALVLFIISLTIIVRIIILIGHNQETGKEVPCYDRTGNIIKTLSCKEQISYDLFADTFHWTGCGDNHANNNRGGN